MEEFLFKLVNVINNPSTAISLLNSEDLEVLEGKQKITQNGVSLPSKALLENLANAKTTAFLRYNPKGAELNIMLSFLLYSTQTYKVTSSCASSLFLQNTQKTSFLRLDNIGIDQNQKGIFTLTINNIVYLEHRLIEFLKTDSLWCDKIRNTKNFNLIAENLFVTFLPVRVILTCESGTKEFT